MLDNFEQVVAAGSELAVLLAAAPRLKALVSSRAALRSTIDTPRLAFAWQAGRERTLDAAIALAVIVPA